MGGDGGGRKEAGMELTADAVEASQAYLSAYDGLIGDARTRRTFQAVIGGIIAGESLRAATIARFSPWVGDGQTCGTTGAAHGVG
jgi:hypothetical protein